MTMNCHRVVNLMSAYVDGELTGAEMLAIRRHLSECPDCAEEYEATRFTKEAVASLGVISPRNDFASTILGRLDEVQVPPFQKAMNGLWKMIHDRFSPVAAAVAASALALILLSAGGMDSVQPRVPTQMVASRSLGVEMASVVPGLTESSISMQPVSVTHDSSDFGGATLELASMITQ